MKKNKMVGKIIDCALNVMIVIFAILLLISMYTTFQIKILKNEYSNFFGYSLFEVQTGSMHKTIEAGDWIIVKTTKNVEIGDIVTYKHNKEYITHRIIESYKGTFVTKGDANNAKDDPIDQSQIVGKVVKTLPGFGIMRKTIFNPIVVALLITTLYLFNLTFKTNQTKFDKTMKQILDKIIKEIKKKLNKNKNNLIKEVKTEKIEPKEKIKEIKLIEKEKSKETEEAVPTVEQNSNEEQKSNEEELSKTAMFRKIIVQEHEEELEKTEVLDLEELEKTSMYRIIKVDTSDITKNEEIEPNKIEEPQETKTEEKIDKTKIKLTAEQIIPEKKEDIKPIKEIIKERIKNKKAKNIVEKTIEIKKIIYDEILNSILKTEKAYIRKSNVRNQFMDEYINEKFYNQTKESKLQSKILEFSETLRYKAIRDEKQLNIINAYTKSFILISEIEENISKINLKNILKKQFDYDEEIIENIEYEINEIFSSSSECLNEILKKIDTNTFEVKYSKIGREKKLYGAILNHNIKFNKLYSEYIVDKTYTEGIIAEDKIAVLLNLIMIKLVNNIQSSDYETKYIIHITDELYGKDKKLDKILSVIDNEYSKNHITILTTLESMLKNKDDIKRLKKRGYNFAIVYNKKINLKNDDLGYIYMADYHFIDSKDENIEILETMPKEIINQVIKDNISVKIGNFRSE